MSIILLAVGGKRKGHGKSGWQAHRGRRSGRACPAVAGRAGGGRWPAAAARAARCARRAARGAAPAGQCAPPAPTGACKPPCRSRTALSRLGEQEAGVGGRGRTWSGCRGSGCERRASRGVGAACRSPPGSSRASAAGRSTWRTHTASAPQVSEKSTERVPGQIFSNEFLGLKSECAGGRTYSESTRRNSVTPAKSHKFQSKLRNFGWDFPRISVDFSYRRCLPRRARPSKLYTAFVFLGTVFQKPTKTPGESVAAVSPGTSTAAIHQSKGRPRPRSAPRSVA